jgi:uncharacterized SAM-binding protein YcdF (DUF218 family)
MMLKNRRLLWRIFAGCVVCFAAAIFLGLVFAKHALVIASQEVKGDCIVVLGGGGVERSKRAAELFRAEAAPRILLSGSGDCESNQRFMLASGLPQEAITCEDQSKSTKQNAQFSVPLLRKMGAKRVIIVTSWYHSRRALHCFQHSAPDLDFVSLPTIVDASESWLPGKYERRWVLAEYVKLAGYWLRYGISPI